MRAFNSSKPMIVNRKKIISILQKNHKDHVIEYNETIEAWHIKAKEILAKRLDIFKTKNINYKDLNLSFQLPKPECYANQYKEAIGFLELSVDENIELTVEQYQVFVLDKWGWMNGFKNLSSTYKSR